MILAGVAAGFAGAYFRVRAAHRGSRENLRELEDVAHSLAEAFDVQRIAARTHEAVERIAPLSRMELSLLDEDWRVREVWMLTADTEGRRLVRQEDHIYLGKPYERDRLDQLTGTETTLSFTPRDLQFPPRDRKRFRLPLLYGQLLVGHLELEFGLPLDSGSAERLRAIYRLSTDALYAERKFRLAATDTLTDLYLRRYFDRKLAEEVHRQSRYPRPLALAAFDLDHFKKLNDRLGHAAGDEALRRFARILKSEVREQDVCGRRGGEEFAAFFPETDAETARKICERIRCEVETRRFAFESAEIRMTVSAGVTDFRAGENAEGLLSRADAALYQAKDEGRNRIVVLTEERPA